MLVTTHTALVPSGDSWGDDTNVNP